MIRYKVSILEELKKAGYSAYRLRQEQVIAESTIQRLLKNGTCFRLVCFDSVCRILLCQPGDLFEWIPDGKGEEDDG